MNDFHAILVGLVIGVIFFLLTAILAPLLANWIPLSKIWPKFCQRLCDLRVLFAFIFGLAVAFFICFCFPTIAEVLEGEGLARKALLLLLLAAYVFAFFLAWLAVCCRSEGRFFILALIWIALLVTAGALLYLLAGPPDADLMHAYFDADCARLLLAVTLVGVLMILLRAFGCRQCDADQGSEHCGRNISIGGGLLILVLILAGWIVRHWNEEVRDRYELAMVGIWWEGKYQGATGGEEEAGAHLRWAFDAPLPFPQNGFDLYRRESAGGSWTLLNVGGRIHPASTWDGAADPTRWTDRGIDRLPAPVHSRYQGVNKPNFDYLLKMLAYPDLYAPLYFVQDEPEPFTDEAGAAQAVASSAGPKARWQMAPMTLLQTMALHPEVARLLGLYYIDRTADPGTEYDYKIVGHWLDGDRDYVTSRVSKPRTLPLAQPLLEAAESLPDRTKRLPDGSGWWPTEARVGIRWAPPTSDPSISLTQADGLRAVFHRLERQDLGSALGPLSTTPGGLEPIAAPTEQGSFEPLSPIVAVPKTLPNGEKAWPDHFAFDAWVEYRTYDYKAFGIDIFGRESPGSAARRVEVLDKVAPPPPVNFEATIFQRADPLVAKLRQSERDALFPPNSNNDYAIKVSWLWTDALSAQHPDVKAFRLFYKFSNFAAFSDPANRSQWPLLSAYDAQLGPDIPIAQSKPIPARFKDPTSPTGFIVPEAENPSNAPATYYEEIYTNLPPALVAAITANDNPAVIYGFMSVGSVDHDPFNNLGPGATPVTVYSVDLIPPDAPPAPVLVAPPGSADRAGNVQLTMRASPTTAGYRYLFFRSPESAFSTGDDPGSLPPACVATSEASYASAQRASASQPAARKAVNAVPATATSIGADVTDTVDATVGSTQFYFVSAIDQAGNIGVASCPSEPIEVKDRVAPRRPVITKAVGADGAIEISWSGNYETDLADYLIYRTDDEERLQSKRRMQLVFGGDPGGVSLDQSLFPQSAVVQAVGGEKRLTWSDDNVLPGKNYHYRVVARDTSDNASELSQPVSARAVDLTPPAAPTWATADAIICASVESGVAHTTLKWDLPADDPGLRYLVRRRTSGEARWTPISGWISGSSPFLDASSRADNPYEYQLRAMDAAGNRGPWSGSGICP